MVHRLHPRWTARLAGRAPRAIPQWGPTGSYRLRLKTTAVARSWGLGLAGSVGVPPGCPHGCRQVRAGAAHLTTHWAGRPGG